MLERFRFWMANRLVGKSLPSGDLISTLSMLSSGSATARRGTEQLIEAYKTSPWLRSVVSKIAYHFGAIQWRLYLPTKEGKAKKTKSVAAMMYGDSRRKELGRMKSAEELREIETHPLLDLLNNPNDSMSGVAVRRITQIWLDLKGEAFWHLIRNNVGAPIGVNPYPPNWITDIPAKDSDIFKVRIRGYTYNIKREDMVWFRDLDPADPYLRGCGIGESLGDEIDTDEYAAKHVKRYFTNRAQPDLLVSLKGARQEELVAAQTTWDNKFRGFNNAHRAMWTSGDLDVKELQTNFKDMDLVNLRTWQRDLFISIYGIPPEIIGVLTNSNRATVKEAIRILALEVLVPRAEDFRMVLQSQLVKQYDERFILDYDSPVPDDDVEELETLRIAPYVATRGELRTRAGLEDRGELDDVFIMPFNLMPVSAQRKPRTTPEPTPTPTETPEPTPTPEPETEPEEGEKSLKKKLSPAALASLIETVLRKGLAPEYLTNEIDPVWQERVDEWGNSALVDLGLSPAFDMRNPLVADYLSKFATEKIGGLVNDTTKDAIKNTLIEGMEAGEGYKELGKRVAGVFDDASDYRAEMIARTETGQAANMANYAAYNQSGVVEKKAWVATRDGRVRSDHLDADNQTVGLNEPFIVGGNETMYPGDTGVPAQDINCRCTFIAVVGEPYESDALDAIWKKFDQSLIPWIEEAAEAMRRGFDKQHDKVLQILQEALT